MQDCKEKLRIIRQNIYYDSSSSSESGPWSTLSALFFSCSQAPFFDKCKTCENKKLLITSYYYLLITLITMLISSINKTPSQQKMNYLNLTHSSVPRWRLYTSPTIETKFSRTFRNSSLLLTPTKCSQYISTLYTYPHCDRTIFPTDNKYCFFVKNYELMH